MSKFEKLGWYFGQDNVLCHNDLLSGNILLSQDHDRVTLIDYEYCGYNYRAYDLANHFCEFGGFDFDIKSKFPSVDYRKKYLLCYLRSHHNLVCSDDRTYESDQNMSSLLNAIQEGMRIEDDCISPDMNDFLIGFDVSRKSIVVKCILICFNDNSN